MDTLAPVVITRCQHYDTDAILSLLREHAPKIGLTREAITGKRVAVKPNLLLAYRPEKAATTHPAVMEAVIRLLRELEPASLIIAESPGGVYHEKTLLHIYQETGMTGVAERTGVPLNYDTSYRSFPMPDGVTAKNVDMIVPIHEADVIVNVCKLKTHALATMTGAAKNLFGVIPGINKFEMHARFKKPSDFFSMVIDLNAELDRQKTVFHLCDGIVGMEGDGPSGGTPKEAGVLLMSRNPFNLDTAAASLMGFTGRVPLLAMAAERGLCPADPALLKVEGVSPRNVGCGDFLLPDAKKGRRFDLIPPFLQPKPFIDRTLCRGCQLCMKSCPQKTIIMVKGKARIKDGGCIKCFCCQELCTFKAVKIKKSFIYKILE
ncbi:MAG: DUF362 domain-containing protein [Ruminococcaceae bacterium]|nr:DUF362 domain-containing protein [Oscillospiraceae bacterium]